MISVQKAQTIIDKSLKAFPVVTRPLRECYGTILREDIYADRDAPAFHKALMDGIALDSKIFVKGKRSLKVQGMQAAGKAQLKLKNSDHCFEITTGAIIPQGCDAVIPIESIILKNGCAQIKPNVILFPWQSIQRRGQDHQKGTLLLKKGTRLTAPRVGIVAAVGKSKIKVTLKPKVAIISTGDELVDIDKKPKLYQTRLSNSYALEAAFIQTGLFSTEKFHIKDNKDVLYKKIKDILSRFDVLVLSGGVSMGKFDFVPLVLKQLGVRVLFHKVAQKPGKPFWFGCSKEGKPVFALPGNPNSTLVCAYRYALPALKKVLGVKEDRHMITLVPNIKRAFSLTRFMAVKLEKDKTAKLVSTEGSGDYGALANSDGFIEVPTKISPKANYFYYSWT